MPLQKKSNLSQVSKNARNKREKINAETKEERQRRLQEQAQRQASERAATSRLQADERRQRQAKREADRRKAETVAEGTVRRQQDAERHRNERVAETSVQAESRRQRDAEQHAIARSRQNEDQVEARRQRFAKREADKRKAETAAEATLRRQQDAQRHQNERAAETSVQADSRRQRDAEQHAIARSRQNEDQVEARRQRFAKREADKRKAETAAEATLRRQQDAQRHQNERAAETSVQAESRRQHDAEQHAIARSKQNEDQVEARRQRCAKREADRRKAETAAEATVRRQQDAQRHQNERAAETSYQANSRRQRDAELHADTRRDQTVSEATARRQQDAQRQRTRRAQETSQERRERLQTQATRQANARLNLSRTTWSSLYDAAYNYDPTIDYQNAALLSLGKMDRICQYCKALKWKDETPGLCCEAGKIILPNIPEPPEPLKTYLCNDSEDSKYFLKNIRPYNSCFQMTSFGATVINQPGFSPTFTIQGQVCHRIGSILPAVDNNQQFLQIYFMGDEEQELNRRCEIFQNLHRHIICSLQEMLYENNNLIRTFKMAKEAMTNDNYKIVIHADRVPNGEHERLYNAPLINEVAVLIVGNQHFPRDIVIQSRTNDVHRISDTHRFYDALQYPLIFWNGQEGYHFNIPKFNPRTGEFYQHKKVSSMDYYSYYLMEHADDFNTLLRFRRLLSQFIVDMYVKVESERLLYIALNQDKLRVDSYINLHDAVHNDVHVTPTDLGQLVILPSSFVNSPRYLHEYVQDTFSYVRSYGRPDLFITFTCNPSWTEFQNELRFGESVTDRYDLVARVFRLKVKKFMSVLKKGCIFGPTICYVYSIEWQKRGLPHAHILIWLRNKIRPEHYDQIISAEIPHINVDPILYNIVTTSMIHGPCGALNKNMSCMKDGKCTKQFPKDFIKETQSNDDGYPLYRRRSPADGGHSVKLVKRINSRNVEYEFDNRWIVPYCPLLSKMFNAHINVEVCNSVHAIKYILKYVNKGNDRAIFNVANDDQRIINEITTYQAGRYVSSNEAAWRLFSFPLHERYPTVTHLAIHLENRQRVYFNDQNLNEMLNNPPDTTLTAFFKLCQTDSFAKTLYYYEVPRYYTWDKQKKQWSRRLRGTPLERWPGIKSDNALGRIYTVHIINFECYCLRLLLHHIKGPTSFEFLKTIDGTEHHTFRLACEALNLLESDSHWEDTIKEAILCKNTHNVRELFAILIATCGLSNPVDLWMKYRKDMSDDILFHYRTINSQVQYNDQIYNEALVMIEHTIMMISGHTVDHFGFQRPEIENNSNYHLHRELNYDCDKLKIQVAQDIQILLPEQREVFNLVEKLLKINKGGIIFIDAPGGTGKTKLLNFLLAYIRQNKNIAIAVATSGIAANLLEGGRTAHSALKLPLNLAQNDQPMCNISKNSNEAAVLKACKILVWDEVTMAHKRALEALDRTLQDLRGNKSVMGGAITVVAGDFRQTLPVITRGTPADELNACIKSSYLWEHVIQKKLSVNMRLQMSNNISARKFSKDLLKIGEGNMETDINGNVHFTPDFCNIVNSLEELIEKVFPNVHNNYNSNEWLCERALLAPTNESVDIMNDVILNKLPGEVVELKSWDTVINEDETVSYPVEYLNSINMSGIPAHTIKLKIGASVILLRNLNAPSLCNGTRLKIIKIGSHILIAQVLTGPSKGKEVFIPRIPIIPNDLPFQFRRVQFPVKLAFAITINKSQGQTLKYVGINLIKSCFSHGQLYVGCSRVTDKHNLYILAPDGTKNIVYEQALQ